MFGLGDIVAKAGASRRMMVVDVASPFIVVAWRSGAKVNERTFHRSRLVLLARAGRIVRPSGL